LKLETRKDEIINTAAKLFKEKGYSAVTMRDLATAMGMKAASLYNHINSKQDILKAIIISIAEEFTSGMTNGMESLNNDWMHLEDQLDYYLQLRNEYETNFLKIIKEGVLSSEVKNSNPEIIMFSMLTTLRSLYLWIPKKEDLSANDLANSLSQVLIDGINN
jgi:AcrR family transcriptional regulator